MGGVVVGRGGGLGHNVVLAEPKVGLGVRALGRSAKRGHGHMGVRQALPSQHRRRLHAHDGHARREDAALVRIALLVEHLDAGHGHDAHTLGHGVGCLNAHGHLAASGDEDDSGGASAGGGGVLVGHIAAQECVLQRRLGQLGQVLA